MKKILSLVLAMLMIISMVPAVFAAETESESDYQAAIDYLTAIGLWKGYGDGEDGSDDQVLRYQMALFTARMSTGRVDKAYWETDVNDSGFTDIDALDAEGLGGVTYAAQQGIVNGIGGGEFAPFDNVTYRDAIVMIVRALGFTYPASGYPWSYINKARELGVLDGITGVTYTVEVKREVIAQLLYNALNAEIAGATLAETAFGVAETIVMVTATEQAVYGADASKSIKAGMVRVAAVDVDGEPMGTEYYAPFKAIGVKNVAQANALLGTTLKLTHKNNFSEFLACESLSEVFENTTEKKDVTVADGKIKLGKTQYTILPAGADYTSITNNQGTISGIREIKVFKAFGAVKAGLASSKYVLAANGNIYSVDNPFTPYALYSALVDMWFLVGTDEAGKTTYTKMSDEDVLKLLELVTPTVEGFSNIGADAYINTKINKDYGVPYDYYKAIASDIDGDGDYDRVTVRQYELFRLTAKADKTFAVVSYTAPVNGIDAVASEKIDCTIADWRFTGVALTKVNVGDFFVAYMADGVAGGRELEIVEVVGGAKADENDNTYVFNAYLRGYDATTNSVIFGSNYETLPFGYFGVVNTTAYVPAQFGKQQAACASATANYLRNFWNKYVTMYVLNGNIIFVEEVSDADNYVILDSFTDFTEDGLKAMAYSTIAGGYAEITVSELNGWNLGGFDYELFTLLKQMADLGLTVKDYPLPVALKKVYKVRYVAEDGSYNLIEAGEPYAQDKNVYVNNFGYILGVNSKGEFDGANRVATSDKDLWIILQGDKIHMFQGKLSTVELMGLDFYKAKNNQFVAIADLNTNLGPILGNVTEGVDYWLYNLEVDKYYNQNFFGQFVYGHFMTNLRTGAIEFVTYDSALAYDKFNGTYVPMVEGAIYQATNKVLKTMATYSMKEVASTEFATGKYNGKAYTAYVVGAGLPAELDYTHPAIPAGVTGHFASYTALRQAMAQNMYEVIYDRDFTNDPTATDVYAAIEKELMANVTFVDRTENGKRATWKGYADKAFTERTIGTDTTAVVAYVMYDYANMSAMVFFDSFAPVVLATETTTEATVAGVAAEVVHASNVLKNETVVTVKFASALDVTDVQIEGAYTDLVVTIDGLSFKVADATYTAAPVITATKLTKLTGLAVASDLDLAAEQMSGDNPGMLNFWPHVYGTTFDHSTFMYDGDTAPQGWQKNGSCLKYHAFSEKFDAQLKNSKNSGNEGLYLGAFITKVASASDLKVLRLFAADDYQGYKSLFDDLDVLVSADGENWTVAASVKDLYASGKWVKHIHENGTAYWLVEIELTGVTGAKYVAVAPTDFNAFGKTGNGQYQFIYELELYK